MRHYLTLQKMSLRAYYRNRQAIFFGLVFPLVIMVIFGLLNLGAAPNVQIGIVDQAHSQLSSQFISHLRDVKAVTLNVGQSVDSELAQLNDGKRDLVAVLPQGLGPHVQIVAYLNGARAAQAGIAQAVLEQYSAQASFYAQHVTPAFAVKIDQLPGKNQTYTDFLVPGVIGMTIMQSGIFSIAFPLVRQKESGILRRLMATPMRKMDYLSAEVVTRMAMLVLQILVLLAVAIFLLGFHLNGSVPLMVLIAALGSMVFIALGFVIAGVSKNEDSVPAIGNLVVLPMMFLSGVFFSIDTIPNWLRVISDRLPLSYLTAALRSISLDGKSLFDVGGDILALAIWLALAAVVATRAFRWEGA